MPSDPDAAIVALFLNHAEKNQALSDAAGRPIFEDKEACQLRYPGSKNVGIYPATSFSHWGIDPETGEQVKVSYAERFARQYRQFKEHAQQTKSGTPLKEVAFLTEARRAELRALNLYTVEALAAIDGNELKNLGPGGRELKNRAIEFIDEARQSAPNKQLMAELEAVRARNVILEEDLEALKSSEVDKEFREMTNEALREYITAQTGFPPVGNANRKTLLRMAMDARPEKVA